MFWKFDLHTTSHIDQLLDREDVTLRELMEEDDVLQECKAQNRRLLLFLSQEQCMAELVGLITTEPDLGLEERSRFRFPNIACELLTSDVSIINDKLVGDESLLEMLYHFLEQEPPLNPLLASFFSKTIGNLIARKTEQVISFLRRKEGFIGLVLKHIDASAMMDLLLRLISCVEPAPLRQEVLNWLNEEKLIQRLKELIHTGRDEERQSNASQTLCDIIRLSRDQANQMQENMEADPLLTVLESQDSVAGLLKSMFEGERSEASVVNGTQVLLTLLETRRSGLEGLMDLYSQGYERSYTVNSSILNAIEPHLQDFQQLLMDPPKKSAILTTVGVLEEPLGNARLHVARLVASLLQTSAPGVCQELCRLTTMDLLLDLFFKYSWNNFLHFQVELCVASILNHPSQQDERLPVLPGLHNHQDGGFSGAGENPLADPQSQENLPVDPQSQENPPADPQSQENPPAGLQNHQENSPVDPQSAESQPEGGEPGRTGDPDASIHKALVAHLFQKCRLVQRILDAWEENDKIQSEGGARRGNMGHLTRIANMVVQNLEKGPVQAHISDLIRELPEDCRGRWESFVDETLRETNRRNTVELVSTHNMHSSSEDDDMESPFPNDLSLQQAFSDYQIQQMTANFVDQFGFNDEEFSEHDENINATFDRIAEINFNLDADDNSANAAAFEACCKERIRQFDDADEEEDIWEEKEINYATQAKSRTRFGVSQTSEGSSRSSLENGGREGDRGSGSDEDDELSPRPSDAAGNPNDCPSWTASFGGSASSQNQGGWDSSSSGGESRHHEGTGWANFTEFTPFSGTEGGPRSSSPIGGSADTEKQAKRNHPKSGGDSAEWPVAESRKAPLVASDSSSSGGSDSEEDDKKAFPPSAKASPPSAKASPPAAKASSTKASPPTAKTSPPSAKASPPAPTDAKASPPAGTDAKASPPAGTDANKKADLKSEESSLSLEKLSLSDVPPKDSLTTQPDRKEDTPQPSEVSVVNGPV